MPYKFRYILTIALLLMVGKAVAQVTVKGSVFGGGDESYVTGSANMATVNIQGDTEILGNVFGGGNEGLVEGSATVTINE